MTGQELIDYFGDNGIDPCRFFYGEISEDCFYEDFEGDEETRKKIIDFIGNVEVVMESNEKRITDRVSEKTGVCFFEKHGIYIKEKRKLVHNETQEWDYMEVEPKEVTVIQYFEKPRK